MNFLFYVPQMAAYGGMERHVCVLAEESAKRGHHVRLLTTSNSLNQTTRASLVERGVDLRELPRKRDTASAFAKATWLWRQTLAAKFQSWDVIYTNGQSALASVVWRAAKHHCRIIHHHHTAADAGEQETWAPRFRQVLARSPELVSCSEATRQNIERAVGRTGTRFLPYFSACPVAAENVSEKKYHRGQILKFGFAGRLIRTKGIDMLCELSRRPELAGVSWQIYGAGPDYTGDHFRPYPNICYHGPYPDVAGFGRALSDLDALALFSLHNEGMPVSLIEAMSAGLPWIASDRGGTRELAHDNANCVLVAQPANPEAALNDTLELVRRIQAGKTSRLRQRAVYDSHYAPAVVAAKWFSYLEGAQHRDTP
ncbi:MAG: glycosyltransferase family 4 protein [Nibricoccus sp.]